jgi:hypothetical protein
MMALTLWQPWAGLVMAGAKPWEFRSWDYTENPRYRDLLNKRIVIHAGARPIRTAEIHELIEWVKSRRSSLHHDRALALLERIAGAHKCRGVVELGAGLGTAVIGQPVPALGLYPDTDRADHHLKGWPLSKIQVWREPIPCPGHQQFWRWTHEIPSSGIPFDILAGG